MSITFSELYRSFGQYHEQLAELAGKRVMVLTIPADALEDRAHKWSRFIRRGSPLANFQILHFLVELVANQQNIYRHVREGQSQLLFLLEQLHERPPFSYANPNGEERDSESHGPVHVNYPVRDLSKINRAKKYFPKIVAYRFWVFFEELDDKIEPAKVLSLYLRYNLKNSINSHSSNATLADKKRAGAGLPPLLLKPSDWLQACNQLFHAYDYQRIPNIFNSDCFQGTVLAPEVVLNMAKCFKCREDMEGVDPAQFDIHNYLEGEGENRTYKFPYPDRIFRYNHDQIRNFWSYKIPKSLEFIDKDAGNQIDNVVYQYEMKDMKKRNLIRMDQNGQYQVNQDSYAKFVASLSPEERPGRFEVNSVITEYFKTTMTNADTDVQSSKYNPEDYCQASVKERKRIMKNYQMRLKQPDAKDWSDARKQEELAFLLDEYHEKMADQLSYLVDPQFEHISPYMMYTMKFFNKFKDDHDGSLCMRFLKRSTNLSLWEDFLTTMMREMELMFDVTSAHFKILINWFSAMNMSDPIRSNKIIVVNYGAAKTSKTFVTEKVEKMCIEGTVLTLSYQTLRSETAEGNYDGNWTVFNEAPEGIMGFNKDKVHGKEAMIAAHNINVEAMNQMKDRTTSGMMRIRTIERDKDTGERIEKVLESYRNSSYAFNTNANPFVWDQAILSRLVLVCFQEQLRLGSRPCDKLLRNFSGDAKEKQEQTLEKYKWIHMHLRLMDEAIEKKKICAVNTEFSRTLLRAILNCAEEMGVPETSCPRKMATIMAAVRIGVKVRAILLAFGSNINPDNITGTRPYQYLDTITTQCHLVDTDPSILVSILGIFKFIYEDPARFYVLRAFTLKYILGEGTVSSTGASSNQAKRSADPNQQTEEERKNIQEEDEELRHNLEDSSIIRTLNDTEISIQKKAIEDGLAQIKALKDKLKHGPASGPPSATNKKRKRQEEERIVAAKRNKGMAFDSLNASDDLYDEDHGEDDNDEDAPVHPNASAMSSSPLSLVDSNKPMTMKELDKMKSDLLKRQKDLNRLEKEQRQMASSYGAEDWLDTESFWTPERIQKLKEFERARSDPEYLHVRIPFCKPNKMNVYRTSYTLFEMSADLQTILPIKVPRTTVEEVLTQISQLVRTRDRKHPVTHKIQKEFVRSFRIEEPFVDVHESLLRFNNMHRFEDAVREVVSKHIDKEQTFTFGQDTDSVHYDEFKLIKIQPNTKDIRILENQEYISKPMRRFNRINLDDAFDELEEMEQEHTGDNINFTSAESQIQRAKRRDRNYKRALQKEGKEWDKTFEGGFQSDEDENEGDSSDSDSENEERKVVPDPDREARKARLKKKKAEDITYSSHWHLDHSLAQGCWARHLNDIGWDNKLIKKYGGYPESMIHKRLLESYNATREEELSLYKASNKTSKIVPLPEIEAYPYNMGFEDHQELYDRDVNRIRNSYIKGDGVVSDELSYRAKIIPHATRLGLNIAEMIRFQAGNMDVFDTNEIRDIARKQANEKLRKLEKTEQQESFLMNRMNLDEQQLAMDKLGYPQSKPHSYAERQQIEDMKLFIAPDDSRHHLGAALPPSHPSISSSSPLQPPPPRDLHDGEEENEEEGGGVESESENQSTGSKSNGYHSDSYPSISPDHQRAKSNGYQSGSSSSLKSIHTGYGMMGNKQKFSLKSTSSSLQPIFNPDAEDYD